MNEIVDENKDNINIDTGVLRDVIINNEISNVDNIVAEAVDNQNNTLNINPDELKEKIDEVTASKPKENLNDDDETDEDLLLLIDELKNMDQANVLSITPSKLEDKINETAEDVSATSDEEEDEEFGELIDEEEEEQPELTVDITPSLEHYRYSEFNNLLNNVSEGGKLNDTRKSILEYFYDSYANKSNEQEDPVFPKVNVLPKLKYVNNELFMTDLNQLVKDTREQSLKTDSSEKIEKQLVGGLKYIMTLKKNNQIIGQKMEIPLKKYDNLKTRATTLNPGMTEDTLDKLIWSLLYRYTLIYTITPEKYKKILNRFTDDNLPNKYKSVFYDLEKYFGSIGM